jgi:hypothetical protein
MAEFDRDAAFVAACHALGDSASNDRERYPSILMAIDRNQGIAWLVSQYTSEKSQLVRVAIGRALEDHISHQMIREQMCSESEGTRIAAVELAGWAVLDAPIDLLLDEVLDDLSEGVIRAAIVAKQRRRDRRTTIALAHLILEETNPAERSIYLDALIGFADPGDAHRPLHPTLLKALQAVPEIEAGDALKELDMRRKKLHDELKAIKT